MKKLFILAATMFVCFAANAQEDPAAQNASDIAASEPVVPAKPAPSEFWYLDFNGALNYGGTFLQNWAAGGDEYSHTLRAFIDANANYKKDAIFWNNRLQLDFGFLYASSKPILQKSDDRIYFETKFGYTVAPNLAVSAAYDFKSQFAKGFDYKTPGADIIGQYNAEGTDTPATDLEQLSKSDQVQAWKRARVLKSNFIAPAYTTLALGIDWTPTSWFSLNFAPLTGSFVIVDDPQLRKSYGMKLADERVADDPTSAYNQAKAAYEAAATKEESEAALWNMGTWYQAARFELGAQLKMDFKVVVNDRFKYTGQIAAFTDYLMWGNKDPEKGCYRITWDNRLEYTFTKYISLSLITNMIYDDNVMIPDSKGTKGSERKRVQWKEMVGIGLTYKIANK
ncbi:MAG: DUF3078 domain-containing protein [Bacteroidales bacterium]|nr:DUF3078 domain-containing protein [Bacteroidales bacterium]